MLYIEKHTKRHTPPTKDIYAMKHPSNRNLPKYKETLAHSASGKRVESNGTTTTTITATATTTITKNTVDVFDRRMRSKNRDIPNISNVKTIPN